MIKGERIRGVERVARTKIMINARRILIRKAESGVTTWTI
jgi:hypothetical protein